MAKRDFYQVSLKAFLKNRKGEVLILKADPNGSLAGFYDLPGGRIDEDEFTMPFVGILRREIKEEIGDIEFNVNPKPVAVGRHLIPAHMTSSKERDLHVLYLFFEAEYVSGDIEISREHAGLRWVDLATERLEDIFISGMLEGARGYKSSVCP